MAQVRTVEELFDYLNKLQKSRPALVYFTKLKQIQTQVYRLEQELGKELQIVAFTGFTSVHEEQLSASELPGAASGSVFVRFSSARTFKYDGPDSWASRASWARALCVAKAGEVNARDSEAKENI